MQHFAKFISLILIVLSIGCQSNNKNKIVTADIINNPATASGKSSDKNMPEISFEKNSHDFGIIIQGEKVQHLFTFKNTGSSDLIIKDATASCGCTVPSYPKKPISPGEEGEIEVVFNSSNRSGQQMKTITVWSNTQPNQTRLQIECEIVVPK